MSICISNCFLTRISLTLVNLSFFITRLAILYIILWQVYVRKEGSVQTSTRHVGYIFLMIEKSIQNTTNSGSVNLMSYRLITHLYLDLYPSLHFHTYAQYLLLCNNNRTSTCSIGQLYWEVSVWVSPESKYICNNIYVPKKTNR
jgi:hypothetical protein